MEVGGRPRQEGRHAGRWASRWWGGGWATVTGRLKDNIVVVGGIGTREKKERQDENGTSCGPIYQSTLVMRSTVSNSRPISMVRNLIHANVKSLSCSTLL